MEIYSLDIRQLQADTQDINTLLNKLHIAGETLVDRRTIISSYILPFMQSLRNDLKVVIETEYVDIAYRDSYYCYYASKLQSYQRGCVRLSFFDNAFDDSKELKQENNYRNNYLGFLILRPLHKCIGRNVISPKAKTNSDILICESIVPTSCTGVKLLAKGFPHASQDGETMTCAQTTIWALLEYFGNKYSKYAPTLPSLIEKALEPYLFERLMPSSGLTYNQISVALRQFGFGPRIYDKKKETGFNEIFTCYIESGIPLAVAMTDSKGHGHAVVCVGRKNYDRKSMLAGNVHSKLKGKNVRYWNQCIEEFVFNDDNQPSYIVGNIENTAQYYGTSSQLSGMKISLIIAPLYSKIYMDAKMALNISKQLIDKVIDIEDDSVVRTFLTSTRTYREYLITDSGMTDNEVRTLLTLQEPKFVWITEISTYDHFINNKVDAVIVMDATSGKRNVISSVVYMLDKGSIHLFHATKKKLVKYNTNFTSIINSFKGNLK